MPSGKWMDRFCQVEESDVHMLGHVCEVVDQDGAAVLMQVLDVTSVVRGVIFHEIVMRSGDRDEEIENVDAVQEEVTQGHAPGKGKGEELGHDQGKGVGQSPGQGVEKGRGKQAGETAEAEVGQGVDPSLEERIRPPNPQDENVKRNQSRNQKVRSKTVTIHRIELMIQG